MKYIKCLSILVIFLISTSGFAQDSLEDFDDSSLFEETQQSNEAPTDDFMELNDEDMGELLSEESSASEELSLEDMSEEVDFSEIESEISGEEFEEFEDFNPEQFAEDDIPDDFEQMFEESETVEAPFEELGPAEVPEPEPVPEQEVQVQETTPQPKQQPEVQLYDAGTEPDMAPISEPVPEVSDPFMGTPTTDEPNYALEQRLYEIYSKHLSRPMSNEQWQMMIGQRQIETYEIQKGDTLWDISETFFGDGHFWPKIWSLNTGILNPHLVEPGYVIKFMLGSEVDAPAFAITEAGESESESPPESLDQQYADLSEEGIDIPPPSIESRPVLKSFPPSLADWQPNFAEQGYDDVGFSYEKRPIVDVKDLFIVDSIVSDFPLVEIGKINEIDTSGEIATTFQHVFVELPKGRYNLGKVFIVARQADSVHQKNKHVARPVDSRVGYRVQIEGKIKLVDLMHSTNGEKDLFRALVVNAVNPVRLGSTLYEGEIPVALYNMKGPQKNVVAQIIGGEKSDNRDLYSDRSIVFLNKGRISGLEIGDILPVRANRQIRFENSKVKIDKEALGFLKIVHVQQFFSTAIVVSSLKHIYTGDVTGAGVYEPYAEDRVEPIVDQFFDIYDDGKASVSSIFQYNNMNKEDSDIFLSAPEGEAEDMLSDDTFFEEPSTPIQEPEEQFSFDSTESFDDIESDLEFEDMEDVEGFDDFEDSNFEDIFEE
ncbi:MAG: LysM peptidoglycan-binding domain-containing protein [Bdellovibrionales bacterium]|nr:LysM peptidoglycan-binding domain-containing protein [Bdellovibrionales bacterium]